MPGGAQKLRDVRKLADARATLDLDIPVAELPGLPGELIRGSGQVHARVQFGREQGFMVAQVALQGQLELICQRCMGPMPVPIETSSPVLLIESEAVGGNLSRTVRLEMAAGTVWLRGPGGSEEAMGKTPSPSRGSVYGVPCADRG